jgi:diacylglycerol kinase (ATP)
MSAIERTIIFVNAAAGGGRAGRVWDRLLDHRPELSDARLVLAGDVASARHQLDELLSGDAEAVVVLGGDGTAHLVANRILEAGRGGDVALGLVPAGTGSDLARCLQLPRRPQAALDRALTCEPRPFDVLEISTDAGERRFVINVASAGISGAVDMIVNAIPGRGQATFMLATLQALWRYKPVPCRVTVDGEELYDGPFFVVAVGNGRFFGRGMKVTPDAEVDDGLADVVVVPPVPLWQLPYRMPQFLSGRHVALEKVLSKRGTSIRFEPRGDFPPYDIDGEVFPSGAATVRLVAGALRILA